MSGTLVENEIRQQCLAHGGTTEPSKVAPWTFSAAMRLRHRLPGEQ